MSRIIRVAFTEYEARMVSHVLRTYEPSDLDTKREIAAVERALEKVLGVRS
jgi:hypothetical protein